MQVTYKFTYSDKPCKPAVFKTSELYKAMDKDKAELRNIDFLKHDEVEKFVNEGSVYIYRINGEYVACGTFLHPRNRRDIRPSEKNRYKDIGMHVAAKYRGKGYGRSMIQNLSKKAIEKGFIPIAECLVENTASRSTLESAGYVLINNKYRPKI